MNWNRVRYTLWAPAYDRIVRAAPVIDAARRRSIEHLDLQSGERLLIIGAGTGLDLPHLPEGIDVSALDVTPAMLDQLRERARRAGRSVDARVGDARQLPWPAESFDAVLLHLVLAVMPEPERGVREAERVLRRGGRAAVFDKFLRADERPSLTRRAINALARVMFSDLNRRLEPMLEGTALTIERDEPAAFGGVYRIVGLRKSA